MGGKTLLDGDLSSSSSSSFSYSYSLEEGHVGCRFFFLLLYWGCVQYNRSVLGEAKSDTIMKINNKL